METPEEKAKRLDVPFHRKIVRLPRIPAEDTIESKKDLSQLFKEKLMNKVTSICECGKEFTVATQGFKFPCGNNECPFGIQQY